VRLACTGPADQQETDQEKSWDRASVSAYVRRQGTGKRRAASTWWIQYSVRGKRFREFSGSRNRGEAEKLLQRRLEAAAQRFAIEEQSHIDLTSLAVKIADTPCSPIKYECPRSMTLAFLRDRGKDV
jgi:hypothetical protein